MPRRYLTTPLYYVNARPHLGHTYTTILADVLKRHYQARGDDVTFLTGTDEHGEKIQAMAESQGRATQDFVDEVAEAFRTTWQQLGLDFDIFYRTTDPAHIKKVQHALAFLKAKGEIEFREYEGRYCVGCERFLTDTEIGPSGLCPDHQKAPEQRREANYFFLMSRYQDALIAHFEKHTDAVQPPHFRNEVLSFLKQPLGDLCISRPKERLSWGIPLPFDDRFVTYVWFDALLNYLAATGWPDQFDQELWSSAQHLIGKDILKTHAIYWPAMLMALGVPVFRRLEVNGFLLIGGTKMSKSLGNVLRPLELESLTGAETLRYVLLSDVSYGMDSTITVESLIQSVNAHLANGIGNLVSRVLTLATKHYSGKHVPELQERDQAALAQRGVAAQKWNAGFDEYKYQNALRAWSELVTATDLYVNEMKPWALAKDPASADRLETVLWVALRMIEAAAALMEPVLPKAAEKVRAALGLQDRRDGAFSDGLDPYALSGAVPKLFARVQIPVEGPETQK